MDTDSKWTEAFPSYDTTLQSRTMTFPRQKDRNGQLFHVALTLRVYENLADEGEQVL